MGIFDTFKLTHPCPNCQQPLSDWQTKAFRGKCLRRFKQGTIIDLSVEEDQIVPESLTCLVAAIDYCSNCKIIVQAFVKIEKGMILGVERVVVDQ